jgi:hypothetical protein
MAVADNLPTCPLSYPLVQSSCGAGGDVLTKIEWFASECERGDVDGAWLLECEAGWRESDSRESLPFHSP